MEINQKNKEIYDRWYNDYMDSYKNDYDSSETLQKCATIFAINQLIQNSIKTKDYKYVSGQCIFEDVEMYDVIIPYNAATGYFDYPGVILECVENEHIVLWKTEYGNGHIKDDKILTQKFYID